MALSGGMRLPKKVHEFFSAVEPKLPIWVFARASALFYAQVVTH
jgi:hypothetical protein